ncbi:MAG: ribosomal protein [Bacilli bacterium]|nr:ribosomal protein [Bacilli bacterium]
MPNIKSAVKRVVITQTRTLRNAAAKSALRTAIKKFETAVVTNDVENAGSLLRQATRTIDKAVTKGLIHSNAASRRKSRLTKKYNKLISA